MSDWCRSTWVSLRCLLRRMPMFFHASPRTPLRVLGVVACDALCVLRQSRPLSTRRAIHLALWLDLEGCLNARWDGKPGVAADCDELRRTLWAAGYGDLAGGYLDRLAQLERSRPVVGDGRNVFAAVRTYREDVAHLALQTAVNMALDQPAPDNAMRSGHDADVETLWRILMLCQIIDDVWDYEADSAANLPTFLTASASVSMSLALTSHAARDYGSSVPPAIFPFRVALRLFTWVALLAIRLVPRRHEMVGQAASR